MSARAKVILLGLALAVAGGSAARAQSLRQAVEAAWAISPEIATLTARREAIAARRVTARSWFAGAPYVTLGHVTDQVIVNKQQRATESELAVPLWLPGEGTATEQVVDASCCAPMRRWPRRSSRWRARCARHFTPWRSPRAK